MLEKLLLGMIFGIFALTANEVGEYEEMKGKWVEMVLPLLVIVMLITMLVTYFKHSLLYVVCIGVGILIGAIISAAFNKKMSIIVTKLAVPCVALVLYYI